MKVFCWEKKMNSDRRLFLMFFSKILQIELDYLSMLLVRLKFFSILKKYLDITNIFSYQKKFKLCGD